MSARIDRQRFYQLQPELTKALLSLAEAATRTVEPALIHLIKIRSSQLNHCAFCLNMHSQEARHSGERQERLDVLAAWREAPCFNARERAALALCESLTQLVDNTVSDALYAQLKAVFSDAEIADLIAQIVVINSWNRVVATLRFAAEMEGAK